MTKSSAELWEALERAEDLAHGRPRPGLAHTPMDVAQAFHDEVAEIDAQTGRVLPRRILPPVCMVEPPVTIQVTPSRLEQLAWAAVGGLAALVIGWVLLAVFFGWEGMV